MLEQELIKKLQVGDHSAFKEMFQSYNAMVFNVCFRMLDNQQEAEDVTQDVFFKAYKSIRQFRCESKLSTWLYRIAINISLNYKRRKKIERFFSLDFIFENPGKDEYNFVTPSGEGPDAILNKNETERIVQNVINSLPKHQRVALTLQLYEDLSYEEIAEVMNCSVASVESRLHRAKQNLYNKLSPLIKDL